MNKKTHTFVTALLILTFGLSAAYGQNDSSGSFEQNANDIVGTWLADVTVSNCQGTILGVVKALNTFNKGGTMIESATL